MWAYQYAATTGLLGEEARQKYVSESSGQFGILLGGRGDVLGAFAAIYDSPILGHGSWAKDWSYILAQQETMALLGYRDAGEIAQDEVEEGVIPAHSHLLQAWVWAGIIGALFWAWVFVLTVRMLMRIYPPAVVLLPVSVVRGILVAVGYSVFSLWRDRAYHVSVQHRDSVDVCGYGASQGCAYPTQQDQKKRKEEDQCRVDAPAAALIHALNFFQ